MVREMSYITINAGFNASGEDAKLLLSTAWLFKLAVHKVLNYAKLMPVLPASKIAWKNTFRSIAYNVIPNRRYADSAVVLVMGIYESCRQLKINFKDIELGDERSSLGHQTRSGCLCSLRLPLRRMLLLRS
jgi:putative cell wall-binding protein